MHHIWTLNQAKCKHAVGLCVGTAWLALVTMGCGPGQGFGRSDQATQPTPDQVAHMLEPNVLGVSCFYDPFDPWIYNEDRTRIRGIRISALYLRGPNYTGVFGDGIIKPRLYVAYRDEATGERKYQMVKEWAFDVEQAMPFRSKRETRAGWGYCLFLDWGDLPLEGRSIRLLVTFERKDGLSIGSSKKDFRVNRLGSS